MTFNNPKYWQAGAYAQPLVNNPPIRQRTNNARHAVWHFSTPLEVEIYTAGEWRSSDGRYDRGSAQVVSMYCVPQPKSDIMRQRHELSEGESEEDSIIVHMDSHQPENLAIASANPILFPDGLFLAGVGKSALYDTRGFGMIVRYLGLRWRVRSVMTLFYGGDEEVSENNCVYRAECSLFTDIQQEMNVSKSGEVIAP